MQLFPIIYLSCLIEQFTLKALKDFPAFNKSWLIQCRQFFSHLIENWWGKFRMNAYVVKK